MPKPMSQSDLVIDAPCRIKIYIDRLVAVPVVEIQVVALGNDQLGDGGRKLNTNIKGQTMTEMKEISNQ